MSNEKLFTIAIPSYNRSRHLSIGLNSIYQQLSGFEDLVEVIVSDNCSPDDTPQMVEGYIKQGFPIRYIRNETNIGPDRNFLQCLNQASGKYVLIHGDDDVLLDGALKKIMDILGREEFGVVYFRSYGFSKDFRLERPKRKLKGDTVVYDDIDRFIDRVNYWFTFISGNIVNKSLIKDVKDYELFEGTQLNQLGWILPAVLRSKKNAVINEYLIAANNTADFNTYTSVKVFATNFNKIIDHYLKNGLSQKAAFNMNRHLLATFFPHLFLITNYKKAGSDRGDAFRELYPIYKDYFLFWVYIMPLLKLPLPFAKCWLFLIRVVNKLKSFV